MTFNAQTQSIRQKLTTLSSKRGIKYANLETAFLIERLAARLTLDKELFRHLIFKGGFVGLTVYHSPRYTIDLDASWVGTEMHTALGRIKDKAECDLGDGVWFHFERQENILAQGEAGGIRQVYRAGIGEPLKDLKKAQMIHLDIGMGGPVIPEPQEVKTSLILSGLENLSWRVYPIESMIAEKLHALVSHGNTNSRSKDVYDLTVFLPKADSKLLLEALVQCFRFRDTKLPVSIFEYLSGLNTARLEKGWPSAITSISEKTTFKVAFDSLLVQLHQMENRWMEENSQKQGDKIKKINSKKQEVSTP